MCGLLSDGKPLEWNKARLYTEHVRRHGALQFIAVFNRVKDRTNDCRKFGDEVEYMVVKLDKEMHLPRVSCNGQDYVDKLEHEEHSKITPEHPYQETSWKPECGAYMMEGTPGVPYLPWRLCDVVRNMALRRKQVDKELADDEICITLCSFPLLGMPGCTFPICEVYPPMQSSLRSMFLPDCVTNRHARFSVMSRIVRTRRLRKQEIHLSVYKDTNTPNPVPLPDGRVDTVSEAPPSPRTPHGIPQNIPEDHVYMDCVAFGMGCCCLQCTIQGVNMCEARYLYDMLAVVSPLLLALTAAAPIFRGYLVDTDSRWDVISMAVDARLEVETKHQCECDVCPKPVPFTLVNNGQGSDLFDESESYGEGNSWLNGPLDGPLETPRNVRKNLEHSRTSLPTIPKQTEVRHHHLLKSRYSTISCFIAADPRNDESYNDIRVDVDAGVYKTLREAGIDCRLARHVAHTLNHEPILLYEHLLDQDDSKDLGHFDNIQSSVWQSVRFKPPPPSDPSIGWRTEFRPMEIQFTDEENAAWIVFVVLLSRTLISFDLNLYMPISKVDINFARAQHRDAVNTERFYWRRNVGNHVCDGSGELVQATLNEIFNGSDTMTGLVPLVKSFVSTLNLDVETACYVHKVLHFVSEKASGKLWTTAKWIREFVLHHPSYQHDSRVPADVAYDLMTTADDMTKHKIEVHELHG